MVDFDVALFPILRAWGRRDVIARAGLGAAHVRERHQFLILQYDGIEAVLRNRVVGEGIGGNETLRAWPAAGWVVDEPRGRREVAAAERSRSYVRKRRA